MVLGFDPAPIGVEFLRQTGTDESAGVQQCLPFGTVCCGAICADTWALNNPLWSFLPVSPISTQGK